MKTLGLITLMLINLVITSFTLMTMWGWFITPLGLPTIGMAHAFGFSLFVNYIVNDFSDDNKKSYKSAGERIGSYIVSSLIVLGLGWLTTLFI